MRLNDVTSQTSYYNWPTITHTFASFVCSKNNLRIDIPITIGTHGIRADEGLDDEPDLRPLYTKVNSGAELPVALRREPEEEDDEMGEIDISLFESGAGGGQVGKWDHVGDYVRLWENVRDKAWLCEIICVSIRPMWDNVRKWVLILRLCFSKVTRIAREVGWSNSDGNCQHR